MAVTPRAHALGRWAEEAALWHLRFMGYRILGRNVRLGGGELDLVAIQGGILVFCEVKARRGGGAGTPAEAIHAAKQGRLVRLAGEYLQRHPELGELACRFDAVLVERQGWRWRVRVIRDAFRPGW